MIDQTENLENISNYFDEIGENQVFMKEQLTDFSKVEKIKMNFKYCHICMSRNGGLIAICKKRGFLDMQRGAILNKSVVVMFQDGKRRYHIPIDWDYNKRYLVCLDFTQKDDLYGILNDGGIFKFNYNELKHKEILTSQRLKEEGVIKAKFFEKGFIAFTSFDNFYLIKDIKNPIALLICSLSGLIKISPNVEFFGIPSNYSASKKNEFLITNEIGKEGVIQIVQNEEGQNVKFKVLDENYSEILGAGLILREKPQKLFLLNPFGGGNDKDKKKDKKHKDEKNENKFPSPPKDEECPATQPIIGQIASIAISPSKSKIAFYNKERKIAYLMLADFSKEYREINFNLDKDEYPEEENKEIYDALNYEEDCQFLFCGEDTLALSRQRYIIISNEKFEKPFLYLIFEGGESDVHHGTMFSKCISESDGLRYLTNEGVFLISRVPKVLFDISHPFSNSPSKTLVQIYKNTILRKYNSEKDIRSLGKDLPDAIENLQMASANIFWTENENKEFRNELQLFTLKAAQYAKKFVNRDDFNYDKFNEVCKEMRIVNNLRNDPTYPMLITFREYKNSNEKDIISRLIKYNNYQLAADVSKFLDYGIKKVLHKYVISIMKKEIDSIENTFGKLAKESKIEENSKITSSDVPEKYRRLFYHLEKVPGISYIKLAKKAAKLKGEKLARYLLEQEKSSLIKIPQLLELKENKDNEDKKYKEAIHLAFKTYDFNAVIKVLHKIIKEGKIKILSNPNLQKYYPSIVLYLKKYDEKFLKEFLTNTKNNTALFYMQLTEFLNSSTLSDRTNLIKECKTALKKIDNDPNLDTKSLKKYLEKMENGIEFKKICQDKEKAIIHYSEIRPYSVSIYECYKSGYMKGKANFIEPQNKHFDLSSKKLNLLKLRSYLEMKRPDAIDSQLAKTSLKKMGLTPMHLGEMYYDYKYYDKATEYLMQVKDPFYFSYVVDILKSMEKYKEALEVIITFKDIDDKAIMVEEIIRKQPKLQTYVNELCEKHKVSLQ